jgi:hypothetical protein
MRVAMAPTPADLIFLDKKIPKKHTVAGLMAAFTMFMHKNCSWTEV